MIQFYLHRHLKMSHLLGISRTSIAPGCSTNIHTILCKINGELSPTLTLGGREFIALVIVKYRQKEKLWLGLGTVSGFS